MLMSLDHYGTALQKSICGVFQDQETLSLRYKDTEHGSRHEYSAAQPRRRVKLRKAYSHIDHALRLLPLMTEIFLYPPTSTSAVFSACKDVGKVLYEIHEYDDAFRQRQ